MNTHEIRETRDPRDTYDSDVHEDGWTALGNCPTWCDASHFQEDPKLRHHRQILRRDGQGVSVWIERTDTAEDEPGQIQIGISVLPKPGGSFRRTLVQPPVARFMGTLSATCGDERVAAALTKAVVVVELDRGTGTA